MKDGQLTVTPIDMRIRRIELELIRQEAGIQLEAFIRNGPPDKADDMAEVINYCCIEVARLSKELGGHIDPQMFHMEEGL